MSTILLVHTLVFIIFWLTNSLFYSSVNNYLAGALGPQLDYILICLVFSAVLGVWSAARLVLQRLGHKSGPNWLTAIFTVIYLIFFYGSFTVLFSQDPVQVSRLGDLLQYFRLFFDVPLLFGLVWVLRRLLLRLITRPNVSESLLRIGAGLALGLAVFGAISFPPGNVYMSPPGTEPQNPPQLSPKPLLIAHRGASMLAPENTVASAERAAQAGAYGLEGDIRISLDGVLFFMHDDTLKRTTNVATVFPGRENENAANFTFSELRQLSAGYWFVQQDPYGSIATGLVQSSDVERYKTELVPSLAEVLKVVKDKKLVFIFDLIAPPGNHPYFNKFFEICLQQIKDAGIDNQIWFLVDGDQLQKVGAAAPDMTLVAGIDPGAAALPEILKAQGYTIINTEYSIPPASIQDYRQAGFGVNLWTVDEPWQFSRLWLLGVSSITTNNTQSFKNMTEPFFALPKTTYSYIWGLFSLMALGLLYYKIPSGEEPEIEKE
ncbi:MAG TPA: glycerophosphodiester phosphodiesterase family protein [Anaerolineaceae bacterium]